MPARASRAQFRVQHVATTPRGWRVRTKRERGHELRIAFPPGPRRKGAGKLVEILHPKRENPQCEMQKNPLGIEELVIFGNPSKIVTVQWRGKPMRVRIAGNERQGYFGQGRLPGHGWLLSPRFSDTDRVLEYFRNAKPDTENPPKGHKAGCPCFACTRNPKSTMWMTAKQAEKEIAKHDAIKARLAAKAAKKNPRRRNQTSETEQAVQLYQTFQGRDPRGIVEKQRSAAMRMDYTALGDLDYLIVKSAKDGRLERLGFSGDGVKLASSANGCQLYAIGGNQNLNGCLKQFTDDTTKDLYDLGEVAEVQYFARKAVGNFQPVHYYHKFGEETGARPRLGYDALKKELFFAGGEYRIEAPGIIN